MVAALRPPSFAEAVEVRAREQAIPFAGGTDLMVKLRRGAGALPAFSRPVLFLDRCVEIRGIEKSEAGLELGAMLTLADLESSPVVDPVLRDAVRQMGGPALRTVATLGGNICNASPAADTLPYLYAQDARVKLVSPAGERVLPIADFITGPGTTCLRPDELLRSVYIPSSSWKQSLWRKVGTRKANALTKVSIAAFADQGKGKPPRARVALGAVAPTVIRLTSVEELLEAADSRDAPALREGVRGLVRAAVRPIDDQRSTAEYRREVASGLVLSFVEMFLSGSFSPRPGR